MDLVAFFPHFMHIQLDMNGQAGTWNWNIEKKFGGIWRVDYGAIQ
jgi:hypothetical protein